jgi:hypothetical protein
VLDRMPKEDPTSKLATLGVGGERPVPGADVLSSPWPVPQPQGTQRGQSPLGCGPQSGGPLGPSSFFNSYKNKCNRFCGSWSVKGQVDSEKGRVWHIGRLGCKRWDCPVCGPKRARKLRRAIIRHAERLELRRFLTMTLDPKKTTAEESEAYLKDCWRKMRVYLKRYAGESIQFIAVVEFQKNGFAHLHVLVDRQLPHAWIQDSWQAVGGGMFVNIKFVDIHRIAGYLSKYLTKELFTSIRKRGARRYSTSRGIRLFDKPPPGLWELIKRSIDLLAPPVPTEQVQLNYDENGLLAWFRFPVLQTS